jgi:tetratricopeptide (TPR) repeat protein
MRTGTEILIAVKQALDAVIMEEKMGSKWGSKTDRRAGIRSIHFQRRGDMSEQKESIPATFRGKSHPEGSKARKTSDAFSKAILNLGNPHYAEEQSKKRTAGCNDGYGDDQFSKPERVEELSDSGNRKIGDGDFQGAIEDLSEAIRLDPQNSRCYGLRGTAYYELGRYEKSIEDNSKAIDLHSDPTCLYNRSESFYKTSKDDEALSDLNHALALAREMPDYHYLIPEIRKLVSIIEDKTLNREDYYQPLIGWEKNKKSQELDAQCEAYDDVGPFMSGRRFAMKICTTCNELYGIQ